MTDAPSPSPSAKPTSPAAFSARTLIILGGVALVVTGVVVALILKGERKDEEVISIVEQPAPTQRVNVFEVVDARGNTAIKAEVGTRYRVVVEDESRDSAAGIARLGGLVTFVPGASKGDDVVIEVTRLKNRTAEATVIERHGHVEVAATPSPRNAPAQSPSATTTPAGPVYTGIVQSVGQKGDGLLHLNGKVVFVPGVKEGETIVYAIVQDKEKHAIGRLVSREVAAAAPTPAPPAPAVANGDKKKDIALPGEEFTVTILEASTKKPTDGIAKIEGLIVFVPDSKAGDRARIRIAQRMKRSAVAEVIERLPPETAAP